MGYKQKHKNFDNRCKNSEIPQVGCNLSLIHISKQFFERYDGILKKDGIVEFKTDNDLLFQFSLEQVPEAGWNLDKFTWDLHNDEEMVKGNVMTEYESKFSAMGNPIHKLIASR